MMIAALLFAITVNDVQVGKREATYIAPAGKPRAAILFVHWLGPPPRNDRTEFLDDAIDLARDGVASLLVEQPWAKRQWFPTRSLSGDRQFSIDEVQSLRASVDELVRRSGVERVALVGHDIGARDGPLELANDDRVTHAVLMAGTPVFTDWFLLGRKLGDEEKAAYVREVEGFDIARNMPQRKAPIVTLFQFARKDRFVTSARANEYVAAFREPKEVRWYDTEHELQTEEAISERLAWLRKQLLR